jgi:hypothetical protein
MLSATFSTEQPFEDEEQNHSRYDEQQDWAAHKAKVCAGIQTDFNVRAAMNFSIAVRGYKNRPPSRT